MGWKLPKCPIQVADWLVLPDVQVCRWPTYRRVMNKQSTHHSGLVWGWSGVIYGTYDQDKHKNVPQISSCGLDLGVVGPMRCSLRVCFLVKVGMVSLVPAPPWVPAVLMCLPVTQNQLGPPWDHSWGILTALTTDASAIGGHVMIDEDNDGLERAVSKRTLQIGCWTLFLQTRCCSCSACAPRPPMHYGNQPRGYFNGGRPLWPHAVRRLAARPSQSNPRGVWARGSEAWAGSRDLRNLEFLRWGSSGPSSLIDLRTAQVCCFAIFWHVDTRAISPFFLL